MQKFILLRNNGEFFVIVHAAPNQQGKFQWYWMNDPNEDPEVNIAGEVFESITLSSQNIKAHYQKKWLACHCEVEGSRYNEGCVYLTDDFVEMIKANQFDAIDFFGEDGMIRTDVCYSARPQKEKNEVST